MQTNNPPAPMDEAMVTALVAAFETVGETTGSGVLMSYDAWSETGGPFHVLARAALTALSLEARDAANIAHGMERAAEIAHNEWMEGTRIEVIADAIRAAIKEVGE